MKLTAFLRNPRPPRNPRFLRFAARNGGAVFSVWLGTLMHAAFAGDAPPTDVSAELEKIRKDHESPALAGAAMRDGKLIAIGVSGVRKLGADDKVTVEDKWHVGSCTKSMTAVLAAMCVDDGKLKWSSTIAEIFPELAEEMRGHWRAVTLEQLLTHRSGAPEHPPEEVWAAALRQSGTPTEQRLALLRGMIVHSPAESRGSKFVYSNEGYAMAGAMIERVTGRAWEALLRERLFAPLGMTSAGFGAPATAGKIDQPWGHQGEIGELKPVSPEGPNADNPPAIGPAATVHCSITDFARYASWHALDSKRTPKLVSDESYARLHRSVAGQDYAMGLLVEPREWAGGITFWHTGSNAMFYAVMWIAPDRDAVFVAATNSSHVEADDACNEAVVTLIRRVLGKY